MTSPFWNAEGKRGSRTSSRSRSQPQEPSQKVLRTVKKTTASTSTDPTNLASATLSFSTVAASLHQALSDDPPNPCSVGDLPTLSAIHQELDSPQISSNTFSASSSVTSVPSASSKSSKPPSQKSPKKTPKKSPKKSPKKPSKKRSKYSSKQSSKKSSKETSSEIFSDHSSESSPEFIDIDEPSSLGAFFSSKKALEEASRRSGEVGAIKKALTKARKYWICETEKDIFACKMHPDGFHGSNIHPIQIKGWKHIFNHLRKWHSTALASLVRMPTEKHAQELKARREGFSTIRDFTTPRSPPNRREFDREIALAVCVAKHNLPLRMLDNDFNAFLDLSNAEPMVKRTAFAKRVVPLVSAAVVHAYTLQLSRSTSVSVTSDAVQRGNYRFVNVTYHFIDRQDFSLHSIAAHNFNIDEIHTIENIADLMTCHWRSFLPSNLREPFASTTDAGSDMKGAFQRLLEPRRSIHCVCHALNLAVKEAIKAVNPETRQDFKLVNKISLYTRGSNVRDQMAYIQESMGRKKQTAKTKTQVRWNQEFLQLERLIQLRPDLLEFIHRNSSSVPTGYVNFIQSETVFTRLRIYLKVLRELMIFSDFFSGEAYPTLSVVAPAVRHLEQFLEQKLADSFKLTSFERGFYEQVQSAVSSRFKCVFKTSPASLFLLASAVDPRFGDLKFLDELRRDSVFEDLKAMTATFARNGAGELPSLPDVPERELMAPSVNMHSQSSLDYSVTHVQQIFSARSPNWEELTRNPLKFWQCNVGRLNESLIDLACALLSTPASSVPSERNNSAIALLITDRRHRLKTETCSDWLAIRDYVLQPYFSLGVLCDTAWEIRTRSNSEAAATQPTPQPETPASSTTLVE